MARTYANLITEAREFSQDTLAPFRNTDSFYLNHLNRALQELGRIRPDAFYELYDGNELNVPLVVEGTPDATYDEVATTDNFGVDMMFYGPVLSYVVGSSELQDDEFTLEGRAIALLTQFRNTALGL